MDMERLAIAGRIKGKRSMPVVPRVSPYQDVRRFAARVLGDLDFDEVAVALSLALKKDDTELRGVAADSLARIGSRRSLPDEAVEALQEALPGADRDLRLLLIRGLGTVKNDSTVEVLERYLGDEDSFIRTEAIRGLSLPGQTNPAFAGLLKDPDPAVRLAAAHALAVGGEDSATDLLVDFAMSHEGYYRRDAGQLLRNLNVAQANARFLNVLADPETLRIWPAVIEALEELNLPNLPKNNGASTMRTEEQRRSHS
jgi:HEAT repeat protein